MTELTKDEMKVLDAVDGFPTHRSWFRTELRPTFDDLLQRGFIEAQTRYVLSEKAKEIINARDEADAATRT